LVALWCLTPLSTIFLLYRGGQFYWWRKPEHLEKTNIVESGVKHHKATKPTNPLPQLIIFGYVINGSFFSLF
jgi:hypothetical protein